MEPGRQFQPGTVIDPLCNLNKRIVQKTLIYVLGIRDRKVEILGKPVGLEKALLETCPPLKIQVSARALCWLMPYRTHPSA